MRSAGNDSSGLRLRTLRVVLLRMPWPLAVAVCAGMLLALPSLTTGWIADDYGILLRLHGTEHLTELSGSIWDLFIFANGDPEHTGRLIDLGIWPWWTDSHVRAAFCRPVTGMTHWLDVQLWPASAPLMHLHSLLWYGAAIVLVGFLYRRHLSIVAAALATLLFAIDDAHATPIGFLAARNSLVGLVFGLAAVLAHDRWRRNGWRMGILIAPALLAIALFSAEAAAGTLAYLAAHALVYDGPGWRKRFIALIPHAVVVIVWRIIWQAMGFGMIGVELYCDPVREPVQFLAELIPRAAVLLLGQWALPPADVATFTALAGVGAWSGFWISSLVVLVVGAMVIRPAVCRNRSARFFAIGMMLSLIPPATTFPQDRMLLFVGVGAFALVAMIIDRVLLRSASFPESRAAVDRANTDFAAACVGNDASNNVVGAGEIPSQCLSRPMRFVAWALVVIHLGLAPVALIVRSFMPVMPQSILAQCHIPLPLSGYEPRQDVIIVNAPMMMMAAAYLPMQSELMGLPIPPHVRTLSASLSPTTLTRVDDRTLLVRPDWGYLNNVLDRLGRGLDAPMHVGQRVKLTGVSVEIMELLQDGRPAEARFTFDQPLDDPTNYWLAWRDGKFVRFALPKVGESVRLPSAIPHLFGVGPTS